MTAQSINDDFWTDSQSPSSIDSTPARPVLVVGDSGRDWPKLIFSACDLVGLSRWHTVKKLVQEKQERPAIADKHARRLQKVCTVYVKACGVVTCIASLPIDSVPMVSYYRPIVTLCLKCTVFEIWRHIGRKSPEKPIPILVWHVPWWPLANFSTIQTLPETRIMGLSDGVHFTILLSLC